MKRFPPWYQSRLSISRQALLRFLSLILLLASAGSAGRPALAFEISRDSPAALPVTEPLDPFDLSHSFEQMPDPRVQALIDQITPTLVYSNVAGLSGEQTVMIGGEVFTITDRNTYGGQGIQHATQFAYERFQSDGLLTGYQSWNLATNPNVIAEQPGSQAPDTIYVITAHLDNKPDVNPLVPLAPGADDNASGSAAVLIAAEILSQVDCRYTLRYVLFTGEEQGLLGSHAYVEEILDQNIEGVLNLDMIGWDSDGDTAMDLYARQFYPDDHRLASTFSRVSNAYDLPLVPEILGDRLTGSDHAAFWDRGFPAILVIEDLRDFNTHYHTPDDRLVSLDIQYMTAIIQASVGSLAHLACLAPPPVFLPLMSK